MADTATKAQAVTPSDSTLIPGCVALFVGTGGDVAVIPQGGTTSVVFKNVGDGTVLPVQASKVMATSTTASNIVALF